jgi:4,5-DOPA dioxygenase extradiol
MSPHWMTPVPRVMTHPAPPTWHDFGGFPPALYELQYPASGQPELAQDILQRLEAAGLTPRADPERPFDHGAWVPLMHMYPQADVPVVQVSLPARLDPAGLLALGRALAPLREQGVLIMGTGSMTHNLSEFFGGQRAAAPYVTAFSRWVEQAVTNGDREALLAWRERAPDASRAHPSDEHFLPLFFALGAASWGEAPAPKVDYISREVMYGMLAMDALAIG